MHRHVLTALMVSSCAKTSKFNGSTAEEQCSVSSTIGSGSMSASRSMLFTRVKEAGREINVSSWSKPMTFCLDIDNINQSSYYLPVYLWGQSTQSEKKSILKALFQAYLMLPSAVLTTQKKCIKEKRTVSPLCSNLQKKFNVCHRTFFLQVKNSSLHHHFSLSLSITKGFCL